MPTAPQSLTLRELRAYASRTQLELAETVAMTQPELSRLERREDCLLSTLRRYVEALGGSVELFVSLGSSSFRLQEPAPEEEPEPDRAAVDAAITALSALPRWLPPLVEGLRPRQLRARKEGCGTFSLLEHVWHLRDLEVEAYGVRLGRMLRERSPTMPDFDGEAAAHQRAYNAQSLEPALRQLSAARKRSVARLRTLRQADLKRMGTLDQVGRISVARLVTRWSGHDAGHRIEMERLRNAL